MTANEGKTWNIFGDEKSSSQVSPDATEKAIDDDYTASDEHINKVLAKIFNFTPEKDIPWEFDALCAETDPETFFPEKGGSPRDAKAVCQFCSVKSECLERALASDEHFGVWGGTSERERRKIRKQRALEIDLQKSRGKTGSGTRVR